MASGGPARDDERSEAGSFGAAEVAAMLGVTRQAVQARARRGSLRAFKVDGEWRIPAEVATALVSAEHHRGLSAGTVRALPGVGAILAVADGGGGAVLAALEARLVAYDVRITEQDRRMEAVLSRQRDELAAKDAELIAARAEVDRLRRAVLALAGGVDRP